jgi:hypothetical protein
MIRDKLPLLTAAFFLPPGWGARPMTLMLWLDQEIDYVDERGTHVVDTGGCFIEFGIYHK